jgi:hypothetical protein
MVSDPVSPADGVPRLALAEAEVEDRQFFAQATAVYGSTP